MMGFIGSEKLVKQIQARLSEAALSAPVKRGRLRNAEFVARPGAESIAVWQPSIVAYVTNSSEDGEPVVIDIEELSALIEAGVLVEHLGGGRVRIGADLFSPSVEPAEPQENGQQPQPNLTEIADGLEARHARELSEGLAEAIEDKPCPDCGGSKVYVGLHETKPCPTCQGE